MFKGLTAWFSRSVSRTKRQKWVAGGGKEASLDSAQFIFSQDAHTPDTLRIFDSAAYLDEHLSVFHANYITECVKKGSMEVVALGKYILLPTEVQEVVKREIGIKFHWETDGNTSDGQSVHSDSEDELPGPQTTSGKPQKNGQVNKSDQRAGSSGIQSSKTQDQSKTVTVNKQKENQSNPKPSAHTENQSQPTGQEKSQNRKQQNQSKESRQSDKTLKDVRTDGQNRDTEKNR